MKLLRFALCAAACLSPALAVSAPIPDAGTLILTQRQIPAISKSSVSPPPLQLAQNNKAQGPTYAPGGHAIIPTVPQTNYAPRYVPPPQQYSPPPQQYGSPVYNQPRYQPATPTYAPGGHAIIPTVPQANNGPAYAPGSQQYRPPAYNQPSFQSNGPTYAPGGHAIVPTAPQQTVPTFSPQFSGRGQPLSNASPNQASGSRLPLSPTSSGTASNTNQRNQLPSNQKNVATFPSAGTNTLNSFQGIGGQSTAATVGVVPPPTSGRLQLTPLTPSNANAASANLKGQNQGLLRGVEGAVVDGAKRYGGAVANAAKAGVEKVKAGEDKAVKTNNPLVLLEGSAAIAAGAIQAVASPIAPVFSPVNKGINAVADKVSDNPAVQNFANSRAGQVTSRIAEDTANVTTIIGAVGGPKGAGAVERPAAAVGAATRIETVTSSALKPLDWSIVNKAGESRIEHVGTHGLNDLQKPTQGVFYGNPIISTNDAWAIAQRSGIKPVTKDGVDIYVVPRPNSGYAGGFTGQGQNLNTVTIITKQGSSQIITSYPGNGTPMPGR